MRTISEKLENQIEINKSIFITYLYPVKDVDEIKELLKEVKLIHPNATHHVSAYVLGKNAENCHMNDDHEPQGTAAAPIMDVLKKQNLSNILCIVVRYFGGIKLGAGGLIRAYSQSCSEALQKANIIDIVEYDTLTVKFNYNLYELIKQHLQDYEITDTTFTDKITLTVRFNKLLKEEIIKDLVNTTMNQIIIEK